MEPSKLGHFYDDFELNEWIFHEASKTIFESDNNLFSLLTMNHHPVHLNRDYSTSEHHGQILVVGTLVFSLVVGLTVPDISGKAVANLGYDEVKHLGPVFIGDTIYAKSIILDKKESKSNLKNGIITVSTVAYNQNNEEVLSFRRTVLVKKKGYDGGK